MSEALALRAPWYARAWHASATWVRKVADAMRTPPPAPWSGRGLVSVLRVASKPAAEVELEMLARSPWVYAAVLRRAMAMATYPIRVYQGTGRGDPVDPARELWAASLLRLLARPDPADEGALFPAEPGEALLVQIVVDLILCGDFFVAVTQSAAGDIIGLARLHPKLVTLEVHTGEEFWVYRTGRGDIRRYPRRSVAHGRLPSWAADASSVFGTGAGSPLSAVVQAEVSALEQTATMVEQGGADLVLSATDEKTAAYLRSQAGRDELAKNVTEQLKASSGRRLLVLGGGLKVDDAGIKPADLKAPELITAAKSAEMAAIGVTPIALGLDSGTYATAVQQTRVQAEADEQIAAVVESALLRPLAQHFARRAGGRRALRADEYTARVDLAGHPGYTYARTDAIARMEKLTAMGWTAEQAAEFEGLDLPPPEGTPAPTAPTMTGTSGAPSRPVGSAGDAPTPDMQPRRLGALFKRRTVRSADADALTRAAAWGVVESRRGKADEDLTRSTAAVLEAERAAYTAAVMDALQAASRAASGVQTRDAGLTAYAELSWDDVLGDVREAVDRWLNGLGPDWRQAWAAAMQKALDGVPMGDSVPMAQPDDATAQWLEDTAAAVADYSRERVRAVTQAGMDAGKAPSEIADDLAADQAFSRERALLIARTETVRTGTLGENARYREAVAAGIDLEQEWLSDPMAAMWHRHHEQLDGQVRPVDGTWTFASGVTTTGPGLSGDPGEDCNCRCARRPRVRSAT